MEEGFAKVEEGLPLQGVFDAFPGCLLQVEKMAGHHLHGPGQFAGHVVAAVAGAEWVS